VAPQGQLGKVLLMWRQAILVAMDRRLESGSRSCRLGNGSRLPTQRLNHASRRDAQDIPRDLGANAQVERARVIRALRSTAR
jgi:hypothetical protein